MGLWAAVGFCPLLIALSTSSCSLARQTAARYPAADIDTIYQAPLSGADYNPVILIHGFTGSTLLRKSDDSIAWGAFFTKGSMLPSKPSGLRSIALDIGLLPQPVKHTDLQHIDDDTYAAELLEMVRADAKVANIRHEVYGPMVEMVEDAGFGECAGLDRRGPPTKAPECFIYFYDWRQDNVGSALGLAAFIERARELVEERRKQFAQSSETPVKFDVVAHSMGSLVTRYFLRYGAKDVLEESAPPITWAGAENFDRVILVSPPNFGGMRVLKELMAGQRYPVVKYEAAMFATWASMYQILPREDLAIWLDAEGKPVDFKYSSAQLWRDNLWGGFAPDQDEVLQLLFPRAESSEDRKDMLETYMDAAFDRARRLAHVLDRHADTAPEVELVLITSDSESTLAKAVIEKTNGRVDIKFGVKKPTLTAPGDGSVTRASALADERLTRNSSGRFSSPVPWGQRIFLTDFHRTLLGNPTFKNNVLQILLETSAP